MSLSGKPLVIINSLKDNPKDLEGQIYNAAKVIGLDKEAKEVKTVFIKPNLTYPVFKKGVTTRVEFIRALVGTLKKYNPDLEIYIGEGEGGYNSFSMTEALRTMKFMDLEKEFPRVKIVNLSNLPVKEVFIDTPKGDYSVNIPDIFLQKIDFSITCPVPKIHCITRVSLSIKNQWGCLPDTMRMKNHYMFNQIVSKICDLLKFKYAFLDGKYGLNRNGPMVGDPLEVNWFAASNSLGAFDMSVTKMMGFDWRKVRHLKVLANLGCLPDTRDIEIIGDIGRLKRKFVLKRDFWNYFPLIAFSSRKITYFFYFSRWAKLLHGVMDTFRKRPIDSDGFKRNAI